MSAARVLVVDDEKLIRWSITERLQRSGHEVVTAESGEGALEAIAASPPEVMVLDVKLPGIDGVETLRRALALQPELAVLMISAHSTVDIAVEAMKHGAVDFLVKPFALQALDEAVSRALTTARTRRQVAAAPPGADEAPVVGGSAAMEALRAAVARLAGSEETAVLVEGESGAGKERLARALHARSPRAARPFAVVNCAALTPALVEAELFGQERPLVAGATPSRGVVETAGGGTILLDEVSELPLTAQARLLQLIEAHTYRHAGGAVAHAADVRVIAATHADLEERVREGRFRRDLYFRLAVVRLTVPPLREHLDDVPALAAHFIAAFNRALGRQVRGIHPEALELLRAHRWPGNVRELRNVIERAFILYAGADEIRPEHLAPELRAGRRPEPLVPEVPSDGLVLDEVERKLIVEALERARGNQSQAARLLGISRDTLRYRLKKHGLG
ncbi:MAG: sigma-54 dependent transcriptional regulator [Anaeromyxobacter sp.]